MDNDNVTVIPGAVVPVETRTLLEDSLMSTFSGRSNLCNDKTTYCDIAP